MKINKYLKKLGLKQYDMPGYYNEDLENHPHLCDVPGADIRNKEDNEGFCDYEFFNLEHTLDLIIYSKLCYFREHCADFGTPSCFSSWHTQTEKQREMSHKAWLKTLDEIIEGFRISIVGFTEGQEGIEALKIQKARHLLAEFWSCLWY